jgi:hypothetical protein
MTSCALTDEARLCLEYLWAENPFLSLDTHAWSGFLTPFFVG